MKARRLHVAETALEPDIPIEGCPAYHFHCRLDAADDRTGEDRTADHDPVGRLLAGLCGRGGVEHIVMGKSRCRELVVHLADQVSDILSIAAAAGTFEGDI